METQPDFREDEAILGMLTDPEDIEAFSNLMEHAHRAGQSAVAFVREEPGRTSRKAILTLCIREEDRPLRRGLWATLRSLWSHERGRNGV